MSMLEILEEIRALPLEERKQLMKLMVDILAEPSQRPTNRRSLRAYKGVGARLYDGTDAQVYVSRLRDEWDDPL